MGTLELLFRGWRIASFTRDALEIIEKNTVTESVGMLANPDFVEDNVNKTKKNSRGLSLARLGASPLRPFLPLVKRLA